MPLNENKGFFDGFPPSLQNTGGKVMHHSLDDGNLGLPPGFDFNALPRNPGERTNGFGCPWHAY